MPSLYVVNRPRAPWSSARLADAPVIVWLWVAAVVFAIGTVAVLDHYGGLSYFPGLVGGFGASLAAFVLALRWDHERERERARVDATERSAERQQQVRERHDQLVVEAQRRLRPIEKELKVNRKSLDDCAKALPTAMVRSLPPLAVNPQLLEGAWLANASRLSEILSDYELVGDLAFTYGRIEELRWRLRERTVALGVNVDIAYTLATMTEGLVRELAAEVDGLLERVRKAIADPPVQLRVEIEVPAATVRFSAAPPALSITAAAPRDSEN
jgi:hypothetical protein